MLEGVDRCSLPQYGIMQLKNLGCFRPPPPHTHTMLLCVFLWVMYHLFLLRVAVQQPAEFVVTLATLQDVSGGKPVLLKGVD